MTVKSDGSIWFSDPPYGIGGNYIGNKAEEELPANVYRVDGVTGAVTRRRRRLHSAERHLLLAR